MDLGDLLKLIVPAIFLVIWALNQIFGREQAAANGRPPTLGPRPGGLPPAPRPPVSQEIPPGWARGQDFSNRGQSAASSTANPDEVFVIRAEPTRPPAPASASAPPTRRGRSRSGAAARRAEPPRTKPLVEPLVKGLSASATRPSMFTPTEVEATSQEIREPAPGSPDILAKLRSPEGCRDAFLLATILGPPRALRPTTRHRDVPPPPAPG